MAIGRANGAFIAVAMMLANVANYGYQIAAGRHLSVAEYGLLSGLMAAISVTTVATTALQTTAARAVAVGDHNRRGSLFDPFVKSTLLVGAAFAVLGVVLTPVASRFFNIGWLPLVLLAAYVIPAALDSIATGRLQGLRRFSAMSVYSCAQALAKLGVGVAVIFLGGRASSLIAGMLLSSGVVAILGIRASKEAGAIELHALDPDVRRAFVAYTLFWMMLSGDVLFARAFFLEEEAGLYGAAAVLGKAVLWIPAIIAQLAFPQLAKLSSTGSAVATLVRRSALVVSAVVLVSVTTLLFAGRLVFRVLYGERYLDSAEIAWKIGLAVAPLALVNLLIQHFLARRQNHFLGWMAVVLALEIAVLYLGPKTATFYAATLAVAGLVLLVALLPSTTWQHLRESAAA